jgi:hypothetical protein
MREIRHKAVRYRQWRTFAVSLLAWLLLLFGAAAIFVVCESPYQDWTYFDGLYMAFVALTTIGYGDITPSTSSGKSFFVLWSLLAVPTVTILVANAEETLLKTLRGIITFIGNISILPGDSGFRKLCKKTLARLSLGAFRKHTRRDLTIGTSEATDRHQPLEVPSSRRKLHIMVLDEIMVIFDDLRKHDLGKQEFGSYSVDRLVWYMRLLKGYQTAENMHTGGPSKREGDRNPASRADMSGNSPPTGATRPITQHNQPGRWYFPEFDAESPLVGPREEAQWILGELLQMLKMELHDIAREEGEEEADNRK